MRWRKWLGSRGPGFNRGSGWAVGDSDALEEAVGQSEPGMHWRKSIVVRLEQDGVVVSYRGLSPSRVCPSHIRCNPPQECPPDMATQASGYARQHTTTHPPLPSHLIHSPAPFATPSTTVYTPSTPASAPSVPVYAPSTTISAPSAPALPCLSRYRACAAADSRSWIRRAARYSAGMAAYP